MCNENMIDNRIVWKGLFTKKAQEKYMFCIYSSASFPLVETGSYLFNKSPVPAVIRRAPHNVNVLGKHLPVDLLPLNLLPKSKGQKNIAKLVFGLQKYLACDA